MARQFLKQAGRRLVTFGGAYLAAIASLWGIAEAFTYFTGEQLRVLLGGAWAWVFYGAPLGVAVVTALIRRPAGLSETELDRFAAEAVDSSPHAPVRRVYDNVELSDGELRRQIAERNQKRLPTYLLRLEYRRRLRQRGHQ